MILTALKELAEAEGLTLDPDYQQRDVSWVIELNADGTCLGFTDIREPDSAGRPRPKRMRVPKIPQRSGTDPDPQFLYENSKFVFGIDVKREGDGKSIVPTPERLEGFRRLVDSALKDTGDAGLAAVSAFLHAREPTTERPDILPNDFRGSDWIVFRLMGDEGLVSDRPEVEAWWREQRVETETPRAMCLVTGDPCVPVAKHDPIKRVPGASGSGVAIVTFNEPAFCSYGLERNENAPISRAAAEAYVRGLNRLLDPACPDPRKAGELLPPRYLRLSRDTVVVFWGGHGAQVFPNLFLSAFSRPDPQVVGRLLAAPRTGTLPALEVKAPFYALTLSGGQGRGTVRDWFTATVEEMAARMGRYFEDLELRFPFAAAPRPALGAVLHSLVLGGDDKHMPPNLAAELFQAILRDRRWPITVLHMAVRRLKAEGPLSVSRSGKIDWNRSHLRMQLVKAYLRRQRRDASPDCPQTPEVGPMLDENNTHPAYLLGRLFATLERLQGEAQGDVNAAIGERFYAAASTAPATAFPQLIRLSRHHLAKLHGDRPGSAVNRDKLITDIMGDLPAQSFPAVFGVEDQGVFAIGYYHQRQEFFRPRDSTESALAR